MSKRSNVFPALLPRLALLSLLVAPGCGVGPGAADGPPRPFESLGQLETALDAVRLGDDPEPFWERIQASATMPLVFGQTALFFYRGEGSKVEWRGDLSAWGPSWQAQGERIGDTDIWRKSMQLLPASRIDYKIVVDGETWLLDPLNPHRQIGGSGYNSEARMPDYRASTLATRRADVARGEFSEYQALASEALGYTVKYRVYTPPGLPGDATDLPAIYVTDGNDYYREDWGAMLVTMDNLYAEERIDPVVAVFISHWNLDATENRRGSELVPEAPGDCKLCDFIFDELMPVIEARYPVSKAGKDRAILGTSLGGLFATYMMLWHGDAFGQVGIQSPAYQYPAGRFIADALMSADTIDHRVFLNVGLYEMDFMRPTVAAAARLADRDVDLLYLEVPDGHSWGHWRNTVDDALLFFYGRVATAPATD